MITVSKEKRSRPLAEERRREILGMLGRDGRITVEEVAKRFSVSVVTARSDLDVLSQNGSLVRSHGGGVRPLAATPEHPLKARESIHHEEKVRIAEAAVQLIRPFQTVILCSGSTSAEIALQLRQRRPQNLTVITYALNIASHLADIPNLSLVMIGGLLRNVSNAFVGPQAETMMRSLHADHCFLSTVGLDPDWGLTTLDIMEAQLNRCMIEAATQVSVIADSSKFGHRSLSLIAGFQNVHRVITDTAASPFDVEKLRSQNVEVLLA